MRDYKKEYREYQGKPEQIKRRSARNKARRKAIRLGKCRKGDGKDVHHRDNNPKNNNSSNLSVTSVAKNRGYPRDRNNKPKRGLSKLAARIENLIELEGRIRKTTKGKNANYLPTKAGAGMTRKGVAAYRRANPGSKLKTAVTGKVKRGSKAAARRKSFCARSKGWTGERGKAARRRWKCAARIENLIEFGRIPFNHYGKKYIYVSDKKSPLMVRDQGQRLENKIQKMAMTRGGAYNPLATEKEVMKGAWGQLKRLKKRSLIAKAAQKRWDINK